jgi:hypothetical protein
MGFVKKNLNCMSDRKNKFSFLVLCPVGDRPVKGVPVSVGYMPLHTVLLTCGLCLGAWRGGDRCTWLSQISPYPSRTASPGILIIPLGITRVIRGTRVKWSLCAKDSGRKWAVRVKGTFLGWELVKGVSLLVMRSEALWKPGSWRVCN